ncbi:MAG: hypothetical protein Q4C98_11545 [Capnocytophaga sp.]|nr:hypothetical protein [Capnocytophaga sp.]
MGVDICSIGNHKLDTSNIEVVAKQLSEIFKINIQYGYQSSYDFDENNLVYYTDNYDVRHLGEVIYSSGANHFLLLDELYFAKNLEEKYGKAWETKINHSKLSDWHIKDLKNQIEIFKNDLKRYELTENYQPKKRYDLWFMSIMKDYLSIKIDEPFRWFGFVENLKKPQYLSEFQEYIQKMREYYQKVGGTEIIYFPDQGTPQLILGRYDDLLWEDIKKYALEKHYYQEYASTPFQNSELEKRAKEDLNEKDNYLVISISEVLQTKNWFKEEADLEILYDDMRKF